MSSVCYRTDSFALPSSVGIDRIQGVPIGLRRPERRLDWPLRGPPVAKIVMARYLANTYPSYEKYLEVSGVDISEASLIQPLKKKFEAKFHAGVNQVLDHQPPRQQTREFSIYTGHGGIAYMCYRAALASGDESTRFEFLEKALQYLQGCEAYIAHRQSTQSVELSFFMGASGIHSLGAAVSGALQDSQSENVYMRKLNELSHVLDNDPASLPDELLCGRAGILWALLFAFQTTCRRTEDINMAFVDRLVAEIISRGRHMVKTCGPFQESFPLMWSWHGSYYLGLAHGVAGILMTLMLVAHFEPLKAAIRPEDHQYIRETLDCLLKIRYPSGNYPSSLESEEDRLVQFCHGAPGFVLLFCQAYKVYDDRRYLQAAKDAAEVVWARGLLKKGTSLCHGSCGNAYAFLALYRLTADLRYLYYAVRFGEWSLRENRAPAEEFRQADHPDSLMEGAAGEMIFFLDILQPLQSAFPGVEISAVVVRDGELR